MRPSLPASVMIVSGLCVLVGQAFAEGWLRELSEEFIRWATILFAFALILGLLNLTQIHVQRIRQRAESWPYSLILLGTAGLTLLAGAQSASGLTLQWLFRYVQAPLHATLLSLVVFFIFSASWRAFRTRNIGVFIMLITAVIVLLGQIPLSESFGLEFVQFQQWVVNVPGMAGQRGILLGVALGAVLTGLRLLLGVYGKHFFS